MKKILIAFNILFLLTGYAQEKKVHLISLTNDKNAAMAGDFYIENVYDGRQVKENIGTVYVSVFNSKVSANFEKPFVEELHSLLSVLYPKEERKKPIAVRINEMYVTETSADSDNKFKNQTGTATVVLDIIEKKSDGKQYVVGTFFSSKEDTRGDVTRKHGEMITAAIKNCFENYKNTKDSYSTPILFNSEQSINFDISNTEIKAGIYLNYQDVFYGKFLSLDEYTITKYKEGFCLLSNETGRVENGFYGFSDGQKFYLNLFQFSKIKYYLKAEIMGGNYFIDEVEERNIDFNNYYLAYAGVFALGGGILPAALFGGNDESEPKKIPLIIDRISGTPIFLTDKHMLNLLKSDEALLKEYKKTKRTPSDKKMMYKKLNGL